MLINCSWAVDGLWHTSGSLPAASSDSAQESNISVGYRLFRRHEGKNGQAQHLDLCLWNREHKRITEKCCTEKYGAFSDTALLHEVYVEDCFSGSVNNVPAVQENITNMKTIKSLHLLSHYLLMIWAPCQLLTCSMSTPCLKCWHRQQLWSYRYSAEVTGTPHKKNLSLRLVALKLSPVALFTNNLK